MKTTVLENLDLYEVASGKWNSIMFTLVEKVVLFQTNCILIKIRKTKGMWKAIILDINNAAARNPCNESQQVNLIYQYRQQFYLKLDILEGEKK